jgi:hypothetical protein
VFSYSFKNYSHILYTSCFNKFGANPNTQLDTVNQTKEDDTDDGTLIILCTQVSVKVFTERSFDKVYSFNNTDSVWVYVKVLECQGIYYVLCIRSRTLNGHSEGVCFMSLSEDQTMSIYSLPFFKLIKQEKLNLTIPFHT